MRKEFDKLRKEYKHILPDICCNCGSEGNIHLHHIVPLQLGGTNNISNIAPVCAECHAKIHGLNLLKAARNKGPRGFQTKSKIKQIPYIINTLIDEKGYATRTEVVERLGYTREKTLTANWIRHGEFLESELERLGIVYDKDPNDKRYSIFTKLEQPGA